MGLNTDWRIEIHHGINNEQASGLSNLIHSLSPPDRQRRSLAPEYYLWKLSQNPSGRGVVALAVNSKKKIIASTTGTYKTLWLNQKQQKAWYTEGVMLKKRAFYICNIHIQDLFSPFH